MASGRYVADQRRPHCARPRRPRVHPVPRPAVRGAARGRRHRARRRRPSDRRPVAADVTARRIVTLVGGPRAPQQHAGAADGRARPGARRGCARRRDRAPALAPPVGDRRGGDRTGRGEPARGVERRIRRSRHFARPGSARRRGWRPRQSSTRCRQAFVSCSCRAPSSARSDGDTPSTPRSPASPSDLSSAVTCCRSAVRRRWTCCTRSTIVSRQGSPSRPRSLRSPVCSAPTRSGRRTTSGTTGSAAHGPSSRRRCSTTDAAVGLAEPVTYGEPFVPTPVRCP